MSCVLVSGDVTGILPGLKTGVPREVRIVRAVAVETRVYRHGPADHWSETFIVNGWSILWLTCPGHATDLVCPPVWVWASSVLLGSVLDRSFSAPGNRGDTLEAGHRRTEVIQPGEGGSSLNLSVRGKLQWKLNWCQSEILHSQGHCPQALTFILCPSQRPPPYVHKTLCTMSKCVHLNNEHVTYKVECWWQFNYKMD